MTLVMMANLAGCALTPEQKSWLFGCGSNCNVQAPPAPVIDRYGNPKQQQPNDGGLSLYMQCRAAQAAGAAACPECSFSQNGRIAQGQGPPEAPEGRE